MIIQFRPVGLVSSAFSAIAVTAYGLRMLHRNRRHLHHRADHSDWGRCKHLNLPTTGRLESSNVSAQALDPADTRTGPIKGKELLVSSHITIEAPGFLLFINLNINYVEEEEAQVI
uniref:Uncharacterized protein n=1 Tax=Glossina austeni TaxID=7395 RepID=A0A1A9VJ98_GLOAU